ncbi:MAG TPA: DUF4261 domain-containing protein [Propionibacteriaceae bacterium]|nr:DUF4261 domain-containing protein [Propionibacteriaceae bacterium]
MTGKPYQPPPLTAELWYERVPDLRDPALLDALRDVSPEAEAQSASLVVPHVDTIIELESGPLPLLTAVLAGSSLEDSTKTLPDVSQTWDWDQADELLQRCTGSILVTEMLARLFAPRQRVHGLTAVVRCLVERTAPLVVSWPESQRITDPATMEVDGLSGVLNVRFFTIRNDPGAMVMDTLGLHLFDLPDIQCHYRDFDAGEVASMLYSTGAYVFDNGDVIENGHTISGSRGDERYVCQHERSLLAPERVVLDVDLGPPYAAGKRER